MISLTMIASWNSIKTWLRFRLPLRFNKKRKNMRVSHQTQIKKINMLEKDRKGPKANLTFSILHYCRFTKVIKWKEKQKISYQSINLRIITVSQSSKINPILKPQQIKILHTKNHINFINHKWTIPKTNRNKNFRSTSLNLMIILISTCNSWCNKKMSIFENK